MKMQTKSDMKPLPALFHESEESAYLAAGWYAERGWMADIRRTITGAWEVVVSWPGDCKETIGGWPAPAKKEGNE
jgi:hypothetical protein